MTKRIKRSKSEKGLAAFFKGLNVFKTSDYKRPRKKR